MEFLKRWLRRLLNLYVILWVITVVLAVLVGAIVDRDTGIQVISMGFYLLVTIPVTFAGSGVIAGLSNGSGNVNEVAFQLGGFLVLLVLVILAYQAITAKKKPKKKSQPRFVRVADAEED